MKSARQWRPTVKAGAEPLYARLVSALERDVAEGALAIGTRLPTQRDLAEQLSIGLGTVTRAYAEAERRGLLRARVGQGTFVASPAPARATERDGPIDLANNLPPIRAVESRFLELLPQLAHDDAALDLLDYAPADGAERYRQAAAAWLTRTAGFTRVEARDLVLCAGATQGVTLALQSVAAPGDTVLCEAATFFGFKSIAERLRLTLVGVAMDDEGVDPDALARAAAETGARVALLIPTLHNPTTRSCSRARRQALAELARRQDLTFVEDDVYAAYARGRNAAPPLATFAPGRSWYVSSASKTLAPGLRAGWILPPREARETLVRTMRALNASAPIFGHLVFAKLVETGEAFRLLDAVVAEARARTELAREVLGAALAQPAAPQSLHAWLPMPAEQAERIVRVALQGNVRLTPPASPVVSAGAPTGVRLCLGAPRERESLARALEVVREGIAAPPGRLDEPLI
jgi:DNA-binding transcriptional MocR family regulator